MKRLLYISTIAVILVSSNSFANNSDFNEVCSYFQALSAEKNLNSMNHIQRNDFIIQRLKTLPKSSNARAAWEAISSADANQRYELYKSAVESVTNKSWDCPAMKKLAPITGEFK